MNNEETNKTSLVCRVKKVVFHNRENGYSVLSVVSDTVEGAFSICGNLKGMPEGTVLHCQGVWKDHIMYGRQFIVDSWKEGEADEVETSFSIPSRANSRPVYKTWGAFLKNNPDIAAKVKYVTEVFFTHVDRDFDDVDYSCGSCDVPFTAEAKAIYRAVYDDQKVNLITCSFTVYGNCNCTLEYEDTYEIEEMEGCVDLPSIAQRYSCFADICDVDGLSELDFHASGVPVCEDEMREMFYKEMADELGEDAASDEDEYYDYTVDNMKDDLELALEEAFIDAGIDYEEVEYQCTSMFSRSKISGTF